MKVEVLKKACRYVFVGVRIAVDSGSRRGDTTSKVGWAESSSIKQVSFSSIALYNLCRSSWACSRFSSLHVPSHLRLEARADDVECCRLGVRGEWGHEGLDHTRGSIQSPALPHGKQSRMRTSSESAKPKVLLMHLHFKGPLGEIEGLCISGGCCIEQGVGAGRLHGERRWHGSPAAPTAQGRAADRLRWVGTQSGAGCGGGDGLVCLGLVCPELKGVRKGGWKKGAARDIFATKVQF